MELVILYVVVVRVFCFVTVVLRFALRCSSTVPFRLNSRKLLRRDYGMQRNKRTKHVAPHYSSSSNNLLSMLFFLINRSSPANLKLQAKERR
jgi:hypothetical protein